MEPNYNSNLPEDLSHPGYDLILMDLFPKKYFGKIRGYDAKISVDPVFVEKVMAKIQAMELNLNTSRLENLV